MQNIKTQKFPLKKNSTGMYTLRKLAAFSVGIFLETDKRGKGWKEGGGRRGVEG